MEILVCFVSTSIWAIEFDLNANLAWFDAKMMNWSDFKLLNLLETISPIKLHRSIQQKLAEVSFEWFFFQFEWICDWSRVRGKTNAFMFGEVFPTSGCKLKLSCIERKMKRFSIAFLHSFLRLGSAFKFARWLSGGGNVKFSRICRRNIFFNKHGLSAKMLRLPISSTWICNLMGISNLVFFVDFVRSKVKAKWNGRTW